MTNNTVYANRTKVGRALPGDRKNDVGQSPTYEKRSVIVRPQLIISVIFFALAVTAVQAEPPHLKDRQTGKYLGNLSANPYDPNSTNNPYGRYGSEYSEDSINNPYGRYGSPYSSDSANNPYATNPPAIYDMGGNGQ